jgi:hypothetical protein
VIEKSGDWVIEELGDSEIGDLQIERFDGFRS